MANYVSKELILEELHLQFFFRPFGQGAGGISLEIPPGSCGKRSASSAGVYALYRGGRHSCTLAGVFC